MRGRLDAFLKELTDVVAIDSGTSDVTGVDRVGETLGRRFEALGARVEHRRDGASGRTLIARQSSGRSGPRLLIVGHLDTVYGPGTAADRPLVVRDRRAYGPGAADMKGGLLLLVHALESLRDLGHWPPAGEFVFVASPDEERGSPVGSIAIRAEASRADVAFVLEPARPNGDLVAARKGMLQGRLRFTGRAAHAGVDPDRGRSAVLAAAHATLALHALTDQPNGITCSVGVIGGGTRPNVIPDDAYLDFDLRAPTGESLVDAEAAIGHVRESVIVEGVSVEYEELGRFAPMPDVSGSRLMDAAVAVGAGLGVTIGTAASGGASDANTIAEFGVPVLDGLGPVGDAIHSIDEHVVVDSIAERAALLGGMIVAVSRPEFRR